MDLVTVQPEPEQRTGTEWDFEGLALRLRGWGWLIRLLRRKCIPDGQAQRDDPFYAAESS